MPLAISLARRRQFYSRLIGWFIAILIAAPTLLLAAMDDIVGTWLRPDQTLVEIRLDGIVATNAVPAGTWEHVRDSSKYMLRFTGARDFYHVTVGNNKRQLTMELQSRGIRTTLERVDAGPVRNPNVPDEKTALQLESIAVQTEMERISLELNTAKREAALFWSKYRDARLYRKPTSMNMKAKQKEAQAKGFGLRLIDLRSRAALISSKINSAR
jgi:hypothetical protein